MMIESSALISCALLSSSLRLELAGEATENILLAKGVQREGESYIF
jgi:hypothetical protein